MKNGKVVSLKPKTKNDRDEPRLAGIWDRTPTSLFLIILGIAVWIPVTYFISPSINIISPAFTEGDIVTKNISAPRDFLVKDVITTARNKIDVEKSAPYLFDYDRDSMNKINLQVSRAFDLITDFYKKSIPDIYVYIEEEEGRTEIDAKASISEEDRLKVVSFEHSQQFSNKEKEFQALIGVELTPRMFKTLRWHHYRKRIKEDIQSIISNVMKKGVIPSKDIIIGQRILLVREIGTGNERIIEDIDDVVDVKETEDIIKTLAHQKIPQEHKALRWVVKTIAERLIRVNMTFNKEATERHKREIVDAQKPVFYQIKKGEMIVREGEPISREQIMKLEALASMQKSHGVLMKITGLAIFVFFFIWIFWGYIKRFNYDLSKDRQGLVLIGLIFIINIALTRLSVYLISNYAGIGFTQKWNYYIIPFAVGPVIISILFNTELTIIFSIINSLSIGFMMEDGLAYAIVALAGGLFASNRVNQYKRRSSILFVGFVIALANSATIISICLIKNTLFTHAGFVAVASGLMSGTLVAVIVSALLPLAEAVFHFTSDIKLLELSDLNHPILSKLVVNAPGTYHHSIIVGNLAEEAAESIGANPLLSRVASYYHDIGKIKKPEYFIENQKELINRHDSLAPSMSGLIIVSHIKDGLELAREYGLALRIMDIIREHHGTGLIYFFYNKAKERENATIQSVKEENFRYPGPKPRTKESAIVLMADAVEAASRTLEEPTHSRLKGLVHKVINDKFIDGQLDNSNLTLRDIHCISESFIRILNGIFHYRVEYPNTEKGKVANEGSDAKHTGSGKDRTVKDKKDKQNDFKIAGA